MTNTIRFIAIVFLLFPIMAIGQKNKNYTIDTAKIIANKNLDSFIQSLRTDTFQNFEYKNAIPGYVKKELKSLANGFSIANPDMPYQCCCTSPKHLPKRQLVFITKSKNVLALTYKTGGWGVSTHLLLIRFDNNKITDLWSGYCGADIKSAKGIAVYLTEAKKYNWELNSNTVIL